MSSLASLRAALTPLESDMTVDSDEQVNKDTGDTYC